MEPAKARYLLLMPFRGFVRRRADLLLALGLTVLAQVEIWSQEVAPDRIGYAALALPLTLALAWRVRAPLAVLAFIASAFVLSTLLVPPSADDAIAVALALLIAVYSAGAHTGGWQGLAGVLATLAVVLVAVAADPEDAELGSYFFFLLVVGGPWLGGRAIRHRRMSERHLEARAVAAEREREERARAAVAEERVRIARELHDVVAHAISVIVLQARGGRRALETDPAETRDALDTIEETGSQALAELRRLLGMLRRDDEEIALAPQPSLRHLEVLAAQVRDAGLPVDLSIEGEPVELPPGVDLSAYRIVQEALTNALKHAGPATARVVVRYQKDNLELEIADTGLDADGSDGEGHGLVGMRERVSLYGGQIEAGARDGGGFAVRARLPLNAARP